MHLTTGTVQSIDRDNHQVEAILTDGQQVSAAYLGTPPWPFGKALFSAIGGSSWVCLGSLGDQRVLVNEEFTLGASAASTHLQADGNWRYSTDYAGTTGATTTVAEIIGGCTLTTTAASGSYQYIRKTEDAIRFPPDPVVWLSLGIRTASTITNIGMVAGFGSIGALNLGSFSAGDAGALLYGSTAHGTYPSTWLLRTVRNTSYTDVNTGVPFLASTNYVADIMLVGNQWAALWINGQGPFVSGTNVPGGTSAADPAAGIGFGVRAHTASARTLYADWCRLAVVSPVNRPTDG